jgi:hypothetical protein
MHTNFGLKPDGKRRSEDIDMDGKIILEWVCEK